MTSTPVIRTSQQAMRLVRQRLDTALSRVGVGIGPSVLSLKFTVDGLPTTRIGIAPLPIPQAVKLVEALGGLVSSDGGDKVANALDIALAACGTGLEDPSIVLRNPWTATRIIPPSLNASQAVQLAKVLEYTAQ